MQLPKKVEGVHAQSIRVRVSYYNTEGPVRMIPCPVSREELHDLYVVRKLIDEDIAKLLPEASVKRVRAWRHRLGIETIPRWSRSEVPPIEDRLRSLLVGSMLGDGRIAFRGTASQFMETHCGEQRDYLEWKASLWGTQWAPTPLAYTPKWEGEREFPAWRMTTVSHGLLNEWQELFYEWRDKGWKRLLPSLVDLVDEFALAVWYLDDGCVGWWPGITFGMDPASRDVAMTIFEKFGLSPRWAVKKGNTGEFTMEREDTAHRFLDLVRPHVPECMSRKVTGFGFQGSHYQVRHKLGSLQEMVGAGMSAREIATATGVGATTVNRHLRGQGLETRDTASSKQANQNKDQVFQRLYPNQTPEGSGYKSSDGKLTVVRSAALSARTDAPHIRRWTFGLWGPRETEPLTGSYFCLGTSEEGEPLVGFHFPASAARGSRVVNITEHYEGTRWEPYAVSVEGISHKTETPQGDGDILDLFG